MKHLFILLIVTFLIVVTGCVASKESSDGSRLIVQSSKIQKELVDTTVFKNCSIISLETNDNSLLRRISRICYADDKLFVLDKSLNKILIFNMKGELISGIHQVGQGPGEYLSIMDFCVDKVKKQILVLCDRPYKIIVFDFDKKLIFDKKLDGLYFNIIADSGYVFCNKLEVSNEKGQKYELHRISIESDDVFHYLPIRTNIKSNRFYRGNQITTTLNTYYTRRFDNGIYLLNNNEVYKKYTIDFLEHSMDEYTDNSTISDDQVERAINKNLVYSISDVVENDRYMLFSTNIGFYVYNKESGKLNGYKSLFSSSLGIGFNSYFPVGNTGKFIAIELKPWLINLVREKRLSAQNDVDDDFMRLANKIDSDDNPVILLYEFKQ